MTSNMTAMSSMVVDISGDNDSAGALAAAANIPSAAADAPFERSCDNPECSAPKLISLVPKRETPEFITEPMIMAQPTLINGFTTVFQIDGIGARMNEIMYGDHNAASATRPKSVFRIVPNTHAHIVNYVVVDGAGETMRKIKANDSDTMRKLLDSQRLSAEQMLKKLVGKAFKVPSHPQNQLPINKVQVTSPTQGQTTSVSKNLPSVPPGITITPVPFPDGVQKQSATPISTRVPQVPVPNDVTSTAKTTSSNKTAAPKRKSASGLTITSTSTVTTATTATTATITTASPAAITSAPILRSVLHSKPPAETPQTPQSSRIPSPPVTRYGRPNILKRKLEETTTETDAIKRLRPRSPKPKCQTPLATGLKKMKTNSPPPTRKLPTLPTKLTNKLPIASVPVKIILPHKRASDVPPERIDHSYKSNRTPITKQVAEATSPSGHLPKRTKETPKDTSSLICHESLPTKTKPLMGPASKMNALKAIAAAKAAVAHVTKTEELASKSSTPKKPGESSIITTTPLTRPCSVTIEKADIPINIIIKPKEPITIERITSSPDLISDSEPSDSPVKEISDTDTVTSSQVERSVLKSNVLKANTTGGLVIKPCTPLTRKASGTPSDPKQNALSALRARAVANQKAKMAAFIAPTDDVDPLALNDNEISEESTVGTNLKTGGPILRTTTVSKLNAPAVLPKADESGLSKHTSDRQLKPRTLPTLPTVASASKLDTPTAAKTNIVPAKAVTEILAPKLTRSSTPKVLPTKANDTPPISSSLSPRSLKIKLPTLKSGVMTIPVRSPHPNLKIASVISGGSAVAAATSANLVSRPSTGKIVLEESGSSDIEKLQLELAALRRTVDRLTKKKP